MILRRVPIDSIIVRPQPRTRFDDADIRRLAESIAASGLQQPLLCRDEDGATLLIDGERRLRAMRLLGWAEADVLVTGRDGHAGDDLSRQLVCNLQREDLGPLERAEGVQRLMGHAGLSADQAAKQLGLSPATISRWLAVLSLPDAIKGMVTSGRITGDAAYQLSRIKDPAKQAALAAQLADGLMTRDGVARSVKKCATSPGSAGASRTTVALGGGRTMTLAGKGLTLDTLIDWIEPLLARARRAKAQGLTLQTFVRTLRDQASM